VVTTASGTAPSGTAADQPVLLVRDVCKNFHDPGGAITPVLDRLSLSVAHGEMVALVGPNGCGKTTLLRLLAGLEKPTSGELYFGGEPIDGPSEKRGLMFQNLDLFPWLTVRGNVAAGLVARGVRAGSRHEIDEFLQLVGLVEFAHVYPHQLSGGMAQRAALARALINRPGVLLLDEPLGALDQFTRMRMQDEVLRLWQARGTTMVLVTHDIDEAIYMSDRIALLSPRPGRVEHVLDVSLTRPRQRTSPEFLEMRVALMQMLHLAGSSGAG